MRKALALALTAALVFVPVRVGAQQPVQVLTFSDATYLAYIDGLETVLTTIDGRVDGLETLLTTQNGYLDGLEGLLDDVEGYLDQLEGYVDGIEAYLNTIDDIVQSEDSAHSSTQKGIMALAVRQDAQADFAADGDYVPFSIDADGALRVAGNFSADVEFLDSGMDDMTEDAADALRMVIVDADGDVIVPAADYVVNAVTPADPSGPTLLCDRDDALSALSEAEADWTNCRSSARGAIWVDLDDGGTVAGYLNSLEGYLDQVEGYVDGLETLLTATNGYVDGLEGLVDGLEALVTSTNGYVDGIEALITSTNGYVDGIEAKLDTIITAVQIIDNAETGASGLSYTSVAATESEHAVKGSPGTLWSVTVTNTAATVAYLRCEDDTSGNTAPGSETPELDLAIPGATTGAGITFDFPRGFAFANALTCWFVTGEAVSDATEVGADDVKAFYSFK